MMQEPNSPRRVLLVGSAAFLSEGLGSDPADLAAEFVLSAAEAVERLARNGVDAVVCRADLQAELAVLIRIRKARPELPILVVTSKSEASFRSLAHVLGATRVYEAGTKPAQLIETLRTALRSGELAKEAQDLSRRSYEQATELRILARETGRLARKARGGAPRESRPGLMTLLVEDDPDQALLMGRAFQKANLVSSLPVLKTGEEAIEYLAGQGRFADRDRYPLPSLVLLDVQLPGKSGLEVLTWMKSRPDLERIRVVMLSGSQNPEHVNRAYELGADTFLAKPTGIAAMTAMLIGLRRRWGGEE